MMPHPKTAYLSTVVFLAGCATNQSTETKPQMPTSLPDPVCEPTVAIIINAVIEPHKPNGTSWDTHHRDSGSGLGKLLIAQGLKLLSVPTAVTVLAGHALANSSRQPTVRAAGPDPFVKIRFGNEERSTPVQLSTSLPLWEFPTLLKFDDANTYVTISVIDADTERNELVFDPIGTTTIKAAVLCKPGLRRLGPFGSVKELTINVKPYVKSFRPRKTGLVIKGNTSWSPTGIQVVQGQSVTVRASGSVCASPGKCIGPKGFPLPAWRSYNVAKDAPHCGLLTRIGKGKPRYVGTHRRFIAGGSGDLWFGTNDTDVGNNTGSYSVDIALQ